MADMMRAMAATGDSAEMTEIPKPTPGPGDVRVKVIASAVNPGEEKVIGDGVSDVDVGAAVWGHLAYSPSQTQGAFAEYVTLPREAVGAKPDKVPYHVAAAAATVAMTGLQSLRDLGGLGDGANALIIGAGGGIGSVAVGIGKRLGGHVRAVCGTKDVERVEALGADAVVDRTKSDPLDAESAYDVVFDTPAVYSFGRCAKMLQAGGTYVTTLPDAALVTGMAHALFTSKRCRFVQVASKRADLELVGEWLSDGLDVRIDSRHKIADLGVALKRQSDRGRVGRVVVDVAEGWPP